MKLIKIMIYDTQMSQMITNFKDDQGHKDKYLNTSEYISSQEINAHV